MNILWVHIQKHSPTGTIFIQVKIQDHWKLHFSSTESVHQTLGSSFRRTSHWIIVEVNSLHLIKHSLRGWHLYKQGNWGTIFKDLQPIWNMIRKAYFNVHPSRGFLKKKKKTEGEGTGLQRMTMAQEQDCNAWQWLSTTTQGKGAEQCKNVYDLFFLFYLFSFVLIRRRL